MISLSRELHFQMLISHTNAIEKEEDKHRPKKYIIYVLQFYQFVCLTRALFSKYGWHIFVFLWFYTRIYYNWKGHN